MPQRIVDLTLPVRNGLRGVAIEDQTTLAVEGYNTSTYHLYSHSGTHMDAPLHFLEGGNTIDRLDLGRCVGPALVVDVSHVEPNGLVTVKDLGDAAAAIGPGTRLLLRSDWDLHADLDEYRSHMPRISAALAEWLVAQGIHLLGLETPSVASLRPECRAELTEVHQILLRAGVVIVESLANLRALTQDVVYFIALPLRMEGRDGSPVRAVAMEGADHPAAGSDH